MVSGDATHFAMPCCFKNDSFNTNNNKKRVINEKCANNGIMESVGEVKDIKLDKIYILQETNKVQEGRFSFLPEYLDVFFNKLVSNNKLSGIFLFLKCLVNNNLDLEK